jgi:hypothetical protein
MEMMAPYFSAGPVVNILVTLLAILLECYLVVWLADEEWLRIWSMFKRKL